MAVAPGKASRSPVRSRFGRAGSDAAGACAATAANSCVCGGVSVWLRLTISELVGSPAADFCGVVGAEALALAGPVLSGGLVESEQSADDDGGSSEAMSISDAWRAS